MGMARLGFVGRIMLIVLCAASALFAAAFGVDSWERARERRAFPRAPLLDRVAAIAALLDGAAPADRPTVLRAVNGEGLRVRLEASAPAPPEGLGRSGVLEYALRTLLQRREPDWRLAAYATTGEDGANTTGGTLGRAFGDRLVRIVVPLRGGGVAVAETSGRVDDLLRGAFGIPPGFWIAVIGFVVALLALLAAIREARPLRDLARSVSLFDGSVRAAVPETGAPEIRRLIRSVNGMQGRIAALLRERSILIGSISHDLKTFLTRLRLRVEGLEDDAQRRRAVADLDQMNTLLDEALAFARGTTVSDQRRLVDVVDLTAIEVAEHAARGAVVAFVGPAGSVFAECDPVALRRVLANLIGNAVAYARRAEVSVEARGRSCRITIDDDGPGIPEAERIAVFSAFHRVDASRNRATGGNGLGLAIAKQIVEAHGGAISAAQSLLGGASLAVELPLSDARREARAAVARDGAAV